MSLEITTATTLQKNGIRAALGCFVLTIASGVPPDADGIDGDTHIDDDTKILYKRDAGTWTAQDAVLAKSVSDSQVTFVTPTAGDGTSELDTV